MLTLMLMMMLTLFDFAVNDDYDVDLTADYAACDWLIVIVRNVIG